ncbi:MAG: hypothetical protein RLZZ450_1991 [Pseudomonadota bacterium]|jgi:sugar lactone lactonase YvrE
MTTRQSAKVVRELVPLDQGRIHGVTFDSEHQLVWFARDDELVAFDPASERVVRRFVVPGACAGTAFDGEHLYQLTKREILVVRPADGRVVRRLPLPSQGMCSGMSWADGHLWVGQPFEAKIHKLDAKTGELVKTLSSDRFVTGVSCVDGALWHATSEDGKPCELRRLANDGAVEETLMVDVARIAGLEGTPDGAFWCAGESGKVEKKAVVLATNAGTPAPASALLRPADATHCDGYFNAYDRLRGFVSLNGSTPVDASGATIQPRNVDSDAADACSHDAQDVAVASYNISIPGSDGGCTPGVTRRPDGSGYIDLYYLQIVCR